MPLSPRQRHQIALLLMRNARERARVAAQVKAAKRRVRWIKRLRWFVALWMEIEEK